MTGNSNSASIFREPVVGANRCQSLANPSLNWFAERPSKQTRFRAVKTMSRRMI